MAQQVNDSEPTVGRLVAEASRDISTLVSKEIELAKSELKVSARAGGMGAAFFAVAGFLAIMFLILLSVTVGFLIHWNGRGLDLHWAFGIVTLFYLLLAALVGFLGYRSIKKVSGPKRAIAHGKQIPDALKGNPKHLKELPARE